MNAFVRMAGSIVVTAFLVHLLIIFLEMVWYRLPSRKAKNRVSEEAGKGSISAEGANDALQTHVSGSAEPQKRIAIITGASCGLGREYALRLDRKSPDIDEFWLIARREEKLRETARGLGNPARCYAADLTAQGAVDELAERMRSEGVSVRYLVNCAGYGRMGSAETIPEEEQTGMIDLNCKAAVRLVNACLPFLGEGSHVVNICSTAAFQPFQKLNIYAASKAFLLRYTRALRMELLPRKIMVTAVCPYWIRDTEFIEKAETSEGSAIRSYPLSSRVSSVAALSLAGIRAGLPVVTPGIVCTLHRLFSKLLPDTVLQYIWEGIRRI